MASRERTWRKVKLACQYLVEHKQKVTVQAVAQIARVQRTTIYRDPELLNFVEKYEKSYHFQKGKDESGREYQRGFSAGYATGKREAEMSHRAHRGSGGSLEWARGILHIDPKEKLTAELVKQKFRQLSKLLHPEKGGVKELQQNVNEANEILKRAVGD